MSRPRWLVSIGAVTLLVAVWASGTPAAVRAIGGPTGGTVKQRGYNDTENPTMSELLGKRTVGGGQARDVEVWMGYGIVLGLAVLIGFCLVMIIRQLIHRTVREPVAEADPTVDLDLAELARSVATGREDRLAALSSGTPAEGVIAAWSHLEASVHAAGVALPLSRTSTEVTVEVLRHFSVDDAALADLADLYREARWSRHPLTEDDRDRAASAYRALDAAVRPAGAASGTGLRG